MAGLTFDDAPEAGENRSVDFADAPEPRYEGALWPVSWTVDPVTGQRDRQFDMGAGLPGIIADAFTLPGDVAAGRADVGPIGSPSQASSDVMQRSLEAAELLSPASAASRAVSASPLMSRRSRMPPTGQELKDIGARQLQQYQESGVQYTLPSLKQFAKNIEAGFPEQRITRRNAPQTYKILDEIANAPPEFQFDALDARTLIDELQDIRNIPDARNQDRRAAEDTIRALYDYIEGPVPPENVVGSVDTARRVGQAHRAGRENYGSGSRSGTLTTQEDVAEFLAATANSGQNVANSLRQRARTIVDPRFKARQRGFSEEELAAIEGIAMGGGLTNAARYGANLLGGGGGMGQALTAITGGGAAGLATGNPLMGLLAGGAAALTGRGLKMGERALTRRAVRQADELIRGSAPAAAQQMKRVGPGPGTRAIPLRIGEAVATAESAPSTQDLIQELLIRAAQRRGESVI